MQTNDELTKRLALAHRIAPVYAAHPNVEVVLLAGSVARGTADRYSDIEIDVFWAAPPTDDDRRSLIAAVGGEIYRVHPFEDDEWAETFYVDGIKVDTSMFLATTMERYLADVVDHADATIEKQLLIAALQHGAPMHGADRVERWRAKAAAYPDGLARTMVAEHLSFRPRFLLEMLAEREDLLMLYKCLVDVERLIVGALLGLNRLYQAHPQFKWMDWQTAQLTVTPPNLTRRLKRALRDEPQAAVREIHQLIDETIALVEQHMPEFDTAEIRAELDQRRVRGSGHK
jgi:hypothetical protein